MHIGKIIQHDFSEDVPELAQYVAETTQQYGLSLGDCIKEKDKIQRAYIKLLEEYNHLLKTNERLKAG